MKQARITSLVSLFPLPQYVVVLEDVDKTHLVPIWIGVSEGNAIALEMNGEKFPRPLTHDLIVNILTELGAQILRVTITDIKENSYFAELTVSHLDKVYQIDARPSDSLAVAVRVGCPIFIDDKVLEKCPSIEKPISEDEVERFKDDLRRLSSEEFFQKLESTPGKKKDIENVLGPLSLQFTDAAQEDEENLEEGEADDADDEEEEDEDGDDEDSDEDEDPNEGDVANGPTKS